MNGATTPFVTIKQASRMTGLSQYFLRGLVRDGQCPGVHSGNRFLVDTEMLMRKLRGGAGEEINTQ